MTKLLSNVYDVTLKRGIRGKAADGFVRPTLSQFFTTDHDFSEVNSINPAYFAPFPGMGGSIVISNDNLTFTNPIGNWYGPYVPIEKTTGKWYIEFEQDPAGASFIGVRTSTEPLLYPNHYAPAKHITYLSGSLYHSAGYSLAIGTIPPGGTVMQVSYDIDNRIFKVYSQGSVIYTYDVDSNHPEYAMDEGEGIYFCAGSAGSSLTIHATPTYSIPGYTYI